MMKNYIVLLASLLSWTVCFGQKQENIHLERLEINKKKSHVFSGRDSVLELTVDTLIMADRARLVFFGKKKVSLIVRHAQIGKRAFLLATDGKNNGSDLDITIRFHELGGLTVSAAGLDAFNGSRTFSNGNGGKVHFKYLSDGILPQTEDQKKQHFLRILVNPGGEMVDARRDIGNILSQINRGSARPLGSLPQGQVYSGSPGLKGSVSLEGVQEF